MPHTFYHGPGLLAAIHVTAALGSAESLIEWRLSDLDARPRGGPRIPEGRPDQVPRGPGLGIRPPTSVIRAYRRA